MSDLTITKYISLVASSELLHGDEIKEHYREFCQHSNQVGDLAAKDFAAYLEGKRLLTAWQNSKLLRGKFKGLKFGKFRMLSLLGVGGMGRVFLAEDEILQRRVALKILPSERSENVESLRQFHQEARALAQLDHKNIVRVHDVSNEGKRHFIVMEYVPGVTLQKVVSRGGPLAPPIAVDYVRQTAIGLSHAHDAGLIHRDIKPANLLLDESGTIKILDLGLALLATDKQEGAEHSDKAVGTADYISPEQTANVKELDQRTDLYSLGCTLFFLLAGKAPFVRDTVAGRLKAHRTELPPSINQFRKQLGLELVSAELSILCGRLLAKNPDERFGSANELLKELETIDESFGKETNGGFHQAVAAKNEDDWWDDDEVEDDDTVTVVGNRTVEILRSDEDKRDGLHETPAQGDVMPVQREIVPAQSDIMPSQIGIAPPAPDLPVSRPISIVQSLEPQKQLAPVLSPDQTTVRTPNDSSIYELAAGNQSVFASRKRSRRKKSKQQRIPPALIWLMVILSVAAIVGGLFAGGVFS